MTAPTAQPLLRDVSAKDVESKDFLSKEVDTAWQIAWPSVVSGIARSAMMSVEGAFLGHLTGTHSTVEYLGASALVFMVSGVAFYVPVAFQVGISPLVGQALGAGNKANAGTWLQLAWLSSAVGCIPIFITLLTTEHILALLGFPSSICSLAGEFGFYNTFWVMPRLLNGCTVKFFSAVKISKPAMYFDVCFVFVHIFVNWILIFGGPFRKLSRWNGFGFIGAALAISLTRFLEATSYFLYMFMWRRAHIEYWPGWNFRFLEKDPRSKFLSQTLPQMASWICQGFMDNGISFMMAKLGTLAIAANSAIFNFANVFTSPLYRALVPVMAVRVGYYLGAGNGKRARRTALLCFGFNGLVFAIIFAIAIPFRYEIISIVTNDLQVQMAAVKCLPAFIFSEFFGVTRALNTDGVLASQGRTRLAAWMSSGVEMPLSLGGVAVSIFYFHANLFDVYWTRAAIAAFLASIAAVIFLQSVWDKYAEQVHIIQMKKTPIPTPPKTPSPVVASPRSPVRLDLHCRASFEPSCSAGSTSPLAAIDNSILVEKITLDSDSGPEQLG